MDKNDYLTQFPAPRKPEYLGKEQIEQAGDHIVKQLKKEGLTYEDAYASLQYAYEQIKYESNFLKLN